MFCLSSRHLQRTAVPGSEHVDRCRYTGIYPHLRPHSGSRGHRHRYCTRRSRSRDGDCTLLRPSWTVCNICDETGLALVRRIRGLDCAFREISAN